MRLETNSDQPQEVFIKSFLCGYEVPTTFLEGYLTIPPLSNQFKMNSVN